MRVDADIRAGLAVAGLALILLVSTPAVALGQDGETVRTPYVEVGDCWSYRGNNLYYQGWIKDYTLCISHIDSAKDIVLGVATVKGEGREIDLSFTRNWGERTGLNGMIFTPPLTYLKRPVRVGDRYPMAVEFRTNLTANGQSGPGFGTMDLEIEVGNWENVTVPAGTFRALKIVGRGGAWAVGQVLSGWVTRTWWYVPEVGRYVKFVHETRINRWSEELTEYRLNK